MSAVDDFTKSFRDITKVFGGQQPYRLGFCVYLGLGLDGISRAFHSAYPDVLWLTAASEVGPLAYTSAAAAVVLLIAIFRPIELSQTLRQQCLLIETSIKNGKLSEADARRIWRDFIQKSIEHWWPELNSPESDKTVKHIKDPQMQ
jgi:hypothetical protein